MTEGRYLGLTRHEISTDLSPDDIGDIVGRGPEVLQPLGDQAEPVRLAEDRSIAVPEGRVIDTAYVRVEDIILACRERMAIGDVERAFNKRLQLGSDQPWPCPRGHWQGERFVIVDGRHEYVATLMLGNSHILVAWVA